MNRSSTRLFPVPKEQQGAARSWIDHGERTPMKPRPASSVVLIRDAPVGTEVYLSYRRGESPLGVVAFPGGSVEEHDDDALSWFGPTPAQWAAALATEDHHVARRFVIAAIRELFEETGVLLAGPDASSLVEGTRQPQWMEAREAIAAGEKTFAEILGKRGLGLRTDLIKPLSAWLSPDFAHRRFDTRYFAAAQPVNQEPTLLASKGVWGQWRWSAEEIMQRNTSTLGDEVGQPNTVGRTLSELTVPAVELILEKIGSSRGCIAYLSHKRPMKVFSPRLTESGGEPQIEVECSTATEGSEQRGR
ncbi:NUDIX hydrolase [uncultured Arthrobacter sp.]|uniref:NUDIX hydrolase n=1 Tax=uncultured Arthrobacter sp. TaxID=114050 RepID=UPI002637273C|nr:NUDIX hydrolase [uncultured Arthrobacter sp.]